MNINACLSVYDDIHKEKRKGMLAWQSNDSSASQAWQPTAVKAMTHEASHMDPAIATL